MATAWYRPLRFRKVDEEGARQAVLHRRPVLTTFCLSRSGWATFSQHFGTAATRSSVLTRSRMASHRSLPDDGGHAVVLVGCDPHSLTFLNSWGHQWGNNGSFGVENHTVLELDGASRVLLRRVLAGEGPNCCGAASVRRQSGRGTVRSRRAVSQYL